MKLNYIRLGDLRYADLCRCEALLPPERQEKIKRLRYDHDKLLSLAAGMMIRDAVGDTPIRTNAHGKPYAVGSDVYYSVSHSGDCVAIAVDDAEIGADVEKLSDRDHLKIAERFYHPNELRYVKEADDPVHAFTWIWTRKEAYLKQRGLGVTEDLRSFDTTSAELSERIASFDIEGYVISVCSQNSINENDIYFSETELKTPD